MSTTGRRLNSGFFRIFDVDARLAAKAMLTGDREQDERRVALLLATLNAVNAIGDLGRITGRVLDLAIELMGAERGILLLFDDGGELTVELSRGANQRDLPQNLDFSRSIAQQVAETGTPAIIVDTVEGTDWVMGRSVADLGLRAIMAAPLKVRTELTGVIYLDSQLARREFTSADLQVFEALSQQFAVTLENAWLNQAMVEGERETAAAWVARQVRERWTETLIGLEAEVRQLTEAQPAASSGERALALVQELQVQLAELEDWAREAAQAPPPEPPPEADEDDEDDEDDPT